MLSNANGVFRCTQNSDPRFELPEQVTTQGCFVSPQALKSGACSCLLLTFVIPVFPPWELIIMEKSGTSPRPKGQLIQTGIDKHGRKNWAFRNSQPACAIGAGDGLQGVGSRKPTGCRAQGCSP